MKKIAMSDLNRLYAEIARSQTLILPIESAGQVDYGVWDEGKTVRLDVLKTVKSAKGAFFPQVEDMLKFHVSGKNIEIGAPEVLNEDFVVFGVRACDARSFELLDRVFLSEPVDPFYAARREHGTVVTLACNRPEETCFCTNFGVDAANPAGDAAAWIVGDTMYLRANTEKGEALLQGLEDADESAIVETQKEIRAITEKLPF